jgi:hypothetical protein
MLRWDPGLDTSPLGPAAHDYVEEVLILSGSMHDLSLDMTFTAGDYACRPPGIGHGPWVSRAGCEMFRGPLRAATLNPEAPAAASNASRTGRREPSRQGLIAVDDGQQRATAPRLPQLVPLRQRSVAWTRAVSTHAGC